MDRTFATRTALVDRELSRYSIDICALSETRFPDEGSLDECEYTFYWIGKGGDEKRESGVGFAIKKSLTRNLPAPMGISDRLMTLRLPLAG